MMKFKGFEDWTAVRLPRRRKWKFPLQGPHPLAPGPLAILPKDWRGRIIKGEKR